MRGPFLSLGSSLNLRPSGRFTRGILKVVTCFDMRAFRAIVHKGENYSMKVFDIVFSPTGGTEKVSTCIANALEGETVAVDLTDSGLGFRAVAMTKEDVAVIAVPSYGGRVPAVAVERLGMDAGKRCAGSSGLCLRKPCV